TKINDLNTPDFFDFNDIAKQLCTLRIKPIHSHAGAWEREAQRVIYKGCLENRKPVRGFITTDCSLPLQLQNQQQMPVFFLDPTLPRSHAQHSKFTIKNRYTITQPQHSLFVPLSV